MKKDFDTWNGKKKFIEENHRLVYAYPREVWWCSLGINIGAEIDGKNEHFERPVIVLKVYNKETMLVLPVTTKEKKDAFHFETKMGERTVWVKLTQARVISNKRLLRKLDVLDEKQFTVLKETFTSSF